MQNNKQKAAPRLCRQESSWRHAFYDFCDSKSCFQSWNMWCCTETGNFDCDWCPQCAVLTWGHLCNVRCWCRWWGLIPAHKSSQFAGIYSHSMVGLQCHSSFHAVCWSWLECNTQCHVSMQCSNKIALICSRHTFSIEAEATELKRRRWIILLWELQSAA